MGQSLPNIVMPTLGGEVFWNNIDQYEGWKLQKNTIFGNCRILDPENYRYAWGGETSMKKLFEKFKKNEFCFFDSFGLPNFEFPTLGGKIFWTDIANHQNYRVQQNNITNHCRLLNPQNIRLAWGSKYSILKAFKKLLEISSKVQKN